VPTARRKRGGRGAATGFAAAHAQGREGFGATDACTAVGGRKPVGGAQRRVEEGHRWRRGRRSHAASRAVPTHLATTGRDRPCGRGPPRPRARVLRRRRKLNWRVAVDRRTRVAPPASELCRRCGGRWPCRRASPRAGGPPPALRASSAAGAGSAVGPAGELRRRRGVHRGDPIARLSPTKPALWETAQICVSHYAACIMPFALAKPGYPPMRATKHQQTALHKPG
jgi:hypothetical protein